MTSIRYLSRHLAIAALIATTSILVPLAGRADPSIAPAPKPAPAPAPKAETTKPDAANATATPSRDDTRARMKADREAFSSARLAALHAGLQLTPDQQGLWPPVETAIRDLATLRREHRHRGDGDQKAGSSIDRLSERGEHLVRMGGALKTLAAATGPLLASLTAEQKERLPVLLRGVEPRRVMARAFALRDDRMGSDGGDHMRRGDMDADMDHDEMRHGMIDRPERGRDDMEGGAAAAMDHGRTDHGWMERGDRDRGDRGVDDRRQADRDERGYGRVDRHDEDAGSRRHHHHHHQDDEDGEDMPSRG